MPARLPLWPPSGRVPAAFSAVPASRAEGLHWLFYVHPRLVPLPDDTQRTRADGLPPAMRGRTIVFSHGIRAAALSHRHSRVSPRHWLRRSRFALLHSTVAIRVRLRPLPHRTRAAGRAPRPVPAPISLWDSLRNALPA